MSTELEEEVAPNDGMDAVEGHPDEVESDDSVPTYGERNRDLPEQLKQAIKNALVDIGNQEKFDRRREVMRDRRNRYYRRGFQHIYENRTTGTFSMGVAGETVSTGNGSVECPNYIGDYNIFRPTELVIESVLTQNPPGIDFRPDSQTTEDLEAAHTAETYREYFDRSNDVKEIQLKIVQMMCESGRTVLWTRTEANKQLWGVNDTGEARAMEICTVGGTLETKVPIMAKSQMDCGYVIWFDDPTVKSAKRQYPHIAKQIKSSDAGICESSYERIARLGVLQGTRKFAQVGEAMAHLVTRVIGFLRPENFTGEKYEDPFEEATPEDVNEEGAPMTVREKLDQLFPDGCHAVFLGDTYAESWNESLDDAIVIGFPYEGDGMSREAMMDDAVVIQDFFNDCMNAMREAADLGWPRTFIDCETDEFDAIQDQRSEPYAFSPMKAKKGQPLEQSFFREPELTLPETVVKIMEYLGGPFLQFVLGTPPALFGGSMEDQKTASGYAQARAQAMGVKGIPWAMLQTMMARMYYLAALAASKNPDHSEEIIVPGKGGNKTLKLERISKGKFGAYPDEDSSFPESVSAKRALLQQLLTMAEASPAIGAQLMGNPENWEIISQIMGFSELKVPEAMSAAKQMREIELLLQQSPTPPSAEAIQTALVQHAVQALQAQQTGAPPPPPFDPQAFIMTNSQPSIMPEQLDFHSWEGATGQDWLSSEECWREQSVGRPDTTGEIKPNVAGVLNVRLHTQMHLDMAKAQAAAMMPPMPPAGRGLPPPPTPGINAAPGVPGTATM